MSWRHNDDFPNEPDTTAICCYFQEPASSVFTVHPFCLIYRFLTRKYSCTVLKLLQNPMIFGNIFDRLSIYSFPGWKFSPEGKIHVYWLPVNRLIFRNSRQASTSTVTTRAVTLTTIPVTVGGRKRVGSFVISGRERYLWDTDNLSFLACDFGFPWFTLFGTEPVHNWMLNSLLTRPHWIIWNNLSIFFKTQMLSVKTFHSR